MPLFRCLQLNLKFSARWKRMTWGCGVFWRSSMGAGQDLCGRSPIYYLRSLCLRHWRQWLASASEVLCLLKPTQVTFRHYQRRQMCFFLALMAISRCPFDWECRFNCSAIRWQDPLFTVGFEVFRPYQSWGCAKLVAQLPRSETALIYWPHLLSSFFQAPFTQDLIWVGYCLFLIVKAAAKFLNSLALS